MGVRPLADWTDIDVIHWLKKDKTMGSNTHWENESACEHSGQPQDVTEKVASAPFPERRRNGVTHFFGTNTLIPTPSPATYPVPFPWPLREVIEVLVNSTSDYLTMFKMQCNFFFLFPML